MLVNIWVEHTAERRPEVGWTIFLLKWSITSTNITASWRPNVEAPMPVGEILHPDHDTVFKHCEYFVYIYLV